MLSTSQPTPSKLSELGEHSELQKCLRSYLRMTTPTTSGSTTHATSTAPEPNPAVATAVVMLSSLPPVLPPVLPPDPVVEDWAVKINEATGEGVAWFIVAGTKLIEAKEALGHGRWMVMFETHRIRFSLRSAEMFMRVAKLSPLSESLTLANLPPRLTTLDVLAGVTVEVTKAGIQSGAIHPEMTAREAREFVRAQNGGPAPAKPATSFDPDKRRNRVQQGITKEALKWPDDTRHQLADLLEVMAKDIRASLPPSQQP